MRCSHPAAGSHLRELLAGQWHTDVTRCSHFLASFSWRFAFVLGGDSDRAPARSLSLSVARSTAAEIHYCRAKYGMTFWDWLDEREAGDDGFSPPCSGGECVDMTSRFAPCDLADCQNTSARSEWMN